MRIVLAKIISIACGVTVALLLPYWVSPYSLHLLDLSFISAIAVLGLCFAFGYAGLLHLGQAAFVGIGAYASAVFSSRFGLMYWVSMPVAVVITAIIAIVIGVPMLRLRGHYLALATVGLNVSVEIVAKNWFEVTGGDNGMSGIPGIAIANFRFDTDQRFFYLVAAMLAVASVIALAIRHSRFGRAMIAVRDDEMACGASGVSVIATKVTAFTIAAAYAGVSGALYAHYAHYVAPNDFDLVRSITLLVMLIVGGETSIIGAAGGAVLISFAPEFLRFLGEAYLAIFGIGVLIILIVMPDGLAGALSRFRRIAVKWQ